MSCHLTIFGGDLIWSEVGGSGGGFGVIEGLGARGENVCRLRRSSTPSFQLWPLKCRPTSEKRAHVAPFSKDSPSNLCRGVIPGHAESGGADGVADGERGSVGRVGDLGVRRILHPIFRSLLHE